MFDIFYYKSTELILTKNEKEPECKKKSKKQYLTKIRLPLFEKNSIITIFSSLNLNQMLNHCVWVIKTTYVSIQCVPPTHTTLAFYAPILK